MPGTATPLSPVRDDQAEARDGVVIVENLGVRTAGGGIIIEGVSFTIAAGRVLAAVGESGSGKTTLAMALVGYARASAVIDPASRVTLCGRPVLSMSALERRQVRGQVASYVYQDPTAAFNPSVRIDRQIKHFLKAHNAFRHSTPFAESLRTMCGQVGLPTESEFMHRYAYQLSGGQLQRVAIGMATLLDPRVIIFDEPTTGLDVATQRRILDLIRGLCRDRGMASLYVTHDLSVVANLADDVIVMRSGRIVDAGATKSIFATPTASYTSELLSATPTLDTAHARARTLERQPQPPRTSPLLRIDEVTARYGAAVAVRGLSTALEAGRCLALIGESGSGKTTISRCIAGFHSHYDGRIYANGELLQKRIERRPTQFKRMIQYVFQSPYASLNPRRTIAESIYSVWRATHGGRPRAQFRTELTHSLDAVRLAPRIAHMYPHQLSGGERQRASIARALIAEPSVLVCDEVTASLDVISQARVIEILKDLQRETGLAMVFVTHNMALLDGLADTVTVMQRGGVAESGPWVDVVRNPKSDYTALLLSNILTLSSGERGPRTSGCTTTDGTSVGQP